MIRSSPKILMLKSPKSLKSLVKCGIIPIKLLKIDWKSNTKKIKKLPPRRKPNTLRSMERLKRKRKENTTRIDLHLQFSFYLSTTQMVNLEILLILIFKINSK